MYSFYFAISRFLFYLTFCGDVLVVYLVTFGVYVFMGVVDALVDTGNTVVISTINTPVVVVPDGKRSAIIYSACIVPYGSDKFSLKFPNTSR